MDQAKLSNFIKVNYLQLSLQFISFCQFYGFFSYSTTVISYLVQRGSGPLLMQLAAFAVVYLSVLNASDCGTVQMFSPQSQKPLEYDVCPHPIKNVHVEGVMEWALYFLSRNQSYRL